MTSVMWSLMPNGSVDELVQKIGYHERTQK